MKSLRLDMKTILINIFGGVLNSMLVKSVNRKLKIYKLNLLYFQSITTFKLWTKYGQHTFLKHLHYF